MNNWTIETVENGGLTLFELNVNSDQNFTISNVALHHVGNSDIYTTDPSGNYYKLTYQIIIFVDTSGGGANCNELNSIYDTVSTSESSSQPNATVSVIDILSGENYLMGEKVKGTIDSPVIPFIPGQGKGKAKKQA